MHVVGQDAVKEVRPSLIPTRTRVQTKRQINYGSVSEYSSTVHVLDHATY